MIQHNRFQNKVAGSVLTLPVCAVLATALWFCPRGGTALHNVLGYVLCALTVYVLMETNNVQHLIRIRTRMMSCVWLMLTASQAWMHPMDKPLIASACLAVSYMLLFRTYEMHRPEAWVYHVFLFLGIGSFCAPVMLLMAILYYIYMIGFLRSLTWRGFWAGILGLLTPYWCWAVWCLLTDRLQVFYTHLLSIAVWRVPTMEQLLELPFMWQASWVFINLLCLVGILHYLHTNYNDKIQTRMMLYIYVAQTVFLMVYVPLQPGNFQVLMGLLLVSGSPLVAHFFSLTGSWLSNAFFWLSLLLCGAMAALNLWLPDFTPWNYASVLQVWKIF